MPRVHSLMAPRQEPLPGGLGGGIGGIIYCGEGTYPNYLYYYFHYNTKGDVVSITDGDKNEVAYYEYDAWGNIMTEAGTWRSPYCFATKERDYRIIDEGEEDYEYKSGLYYFGARYYLPEMGRWTQRDPAGTVDGLNLYIYVGNEPVGILDPWGEQGYWRQYDETIATGVYVFRSGVPWLVQWLQFSLKMTHYWLETPDGTRFDVNFGVGSRPTGTTAYTGAYAFRKMWYTWKSTSKFEWLAGKKGDYAGAGKSCNCATLEEVHACLGYCAHERAKKGYSPLFNDCLSFVNYLLNSCCLVWGDVAASNPDAPPIHK